MSGLVILITGASGGIGAATAVRLAQNSKATSSLHVEAIAIHYNSNWEAAEYVAARVRVTNTDVSALTFKADCGKSAEVEKLYNDVSQAFGRIDVLFANAGTTSGKSGPAGGLEQVNLEDFEATWRVNTLAPYQLTQLVVPNMLKSGYGRVIYTSSVAALTGGVVGPHYASSK